MATLEEIFPPFGLAIRCGPVELRVLRDEDIPGLVDVVALGVVDPQLPTPFPEAWHELPYDPENPDAFPATSLKWWWSQRAVFGRDQWRLVLVVRAEGEIVGVQDLSAERFPLTRSITTGSWLGLAHQRKGTGTLMRQAVVGFAFDHLGALECHSAYIDGNAASAAVSRKTGYQPNGRRRIAQAGQRGVDEIAVRVTPDTYIRPEHPIQIRGLEPFKRFMGIED
nr:GNAT family N-acetyltransferase [Propionibacterium sp.]